MKEEEEEEKEGGEERKHGGAGRRAGQGIKRKKKKGGATAILFVVENKRQVLFQFNASFNHWSVLVILDLINKYQNFPLKRISTVHSGNHSSITCQGPKHHMR